MKVLTAYVGSFCLFWIGHFVSRAFLRFDALAFMYPVYNRLMCWSVDLEDWAGIEYLWAPPVKAGGTSSDD